MAWKKKGLIQSFGSLLLVILLLPCALMNVILTVNNNPENFVLPATVNSSKSLICAVHNHSQGEELLWYRENGRVDLNAENKINSSAICVSVREDDNGVTFTCKLQRDQSMSISVILNVTYGPTLSGNDVQTVEEGSSVKLDCNVKSNPSAEMMWHKNNNVLNLEKNHHQIYQTSELFQLFIAKVQKSDNGTYSCQAKSLNQVRAKDFHLIVEDKKLRVPIEPIIAASVVVFLTITFGLFARRQKLMKLCIKDQSPQSENSL